MKLKAPLYAQIEVTYGCNLGCRYCLNNVRHETDSQGSTKLVRVGREATEAPKYREIAEKVAEWGVFTSTITGGEPLEVMDRTVEALTSLASNGIYVDMNSNLTLAKKDTMKLLIDLGLKGILTSVASYQPAVHDERVQSPGALMKTARGIQLVKRLSPKLNVGANMVVSQENVGGVYETAKFCAELGVDGFSITPLTPSRTGCGIQLESVVNEEQMLQALEDLVQAQKETGIKVKVLQGLPHCFFYQKPEFRQFMSVGCDAGSGYVTINPFGDVMPCAQISDTFGNVLRDDLNQIWNNLQGYQNQEYLPEACQPCDLKHSCGGGCRAEAERRTQTNLKAKHPFMKKPVKLEEEVETVTLDDFAGKNVKPVREIVFRRENDDLFVVQGDRDYAFLTLQEMRMLSSIAQNGLTITNNLVNSNAVAGLLTKTVNKGILEVV